MRSVPDTNRARPTSYVSTATLTDTYKERAVGRRGVGSALALIKLGTTRARALLSVRFVLDNIEAPTSNVGVTRTIEDI